MPVVHEYDLYAAMSSDSEENLVINTWSRKFAIGYDSDGFQEGTEKKKKKKKKKKHKKDKKSKEKLSGTKRQGSELGCQLKIRMLPP